MVAALVMKICLLIKTLVSSGVLHTPKGLRKMITKTRDIMKDKMKATMRDKMEDRMTQKVKITLNMKHTSQKTAVHQEQLMIMRALMFVHYPPNKHLAQTGNMLGIMMQTKVIVGSLYTEVVQAMETNFQIKNLAKNVVHLTLR